MTSDVEHPISPLAEADVSPRPAVGFFVAGPDGRITEPNAVLLERLGLSQKTGNILHCQSILSPESWTLWERQWPDLARQGFLAPLAVVFQGTDEHSPGTQRLLNAWVSITALRDGSGGGACIVQFEDPVPTDGRECFRTLADASSAQIFEMASDGTPRFLNRAAMEFYGLENEAEFRRLAWLDYIHPEDREQTMHKMNLAMQNHIAYTTEVRVRHWQGQYRWLLASVTPTSYPSGEFYGLIGTLVDITERKETELALRQSEERFRLLADASPAQIFDMAPDGTLRFVNQTGLDFHSPERVDEIMHGRWDPEVHPDDLDRVNQVVQNSLRTREPYQVEVRAKRRDGVYRWLLIAVTPSFYSNGEFYGMIGYSLDITAQKETELELKASEERFRIIANASPAHIFDMAPDGSFRFLNQAVMDFIPADRQSDIMTGRWSAEVHPDDVAEFNRLVQNALVGDREPYQIEFRSKRRDGVYRWFFHMGVPSYYPNGEFYGLIGYTLDITPLKETELELKASEERFRIIANASPAHIFDMAPDGSFRFLNQAAWDFLSPEYMPELLKGHWAPAIHPDELANVTRLVQNALQGKREAYQLEIRFKRWDGVYRWFLHSGVPTYYPNGDFYGLIGYSIDITPLKETELELKVSEERFRIIADASPAMIFDMAPDGTARFVNQTAKHYFSPERLLDMTTTGNWIPEVHPDDLENMVRHHRQSLESLTPFRIEARIRGREGVYRWYITTGTPSFYPNGDFYGVIGYSLDISALKEAEFALRESETRWRQLANAVPIMLWVSNIQGETIFVNDQVYQYSGLKPEQILGREWTDGIHPGDREIVLAMARQYSLGEPFYIECRYRRADGMYRWHFTRLVPVKDAKGAVLNWYGSSVDIHDRRIMEMELSKARDVAEEANKKKSQFLANMSHELRTPLNAVIGFSDMMKKGMAGPLTDKQGSYIEHIATSGRHLLTMVNDILDISKAEAGRVELFLQYVELAPFIQQLQELVSYSAEKSGVAVAFEVQPGLAGLVADPDRLKQIFLNLLSNAIKFNHRGGQVNVSLSRSQDQQWVICAIQDTGIGIPTDNIDSLFNEFYQVDSSIARRYEGTGLGLALTKRLVELHHGTITVESQLDVGSTFTFKLPLNPYAIEHTLNN
jgi:PAS domain S-box-containing protein